MAGEKYIVAAENSLQIAVRNILNPSGYFFLGNCYDAISLIRMVRSHQPDFIVVDGAIRQGDTVNVLETIDDEMLCACILIGESRDSVILTMMERSNALSFCPKPLNRDLLLQTVEMANINFKRVLGYGRKLREMSATNESRKIVDRAKLMLMEKEGLSEKAAYGHMRKKSMDLRLTLKEVAESILRSGGVK